MIEILSRSKEGEKIEKFIKNNLDEIFINELNLEEIKYVICRKNGKDKAEEVESFLRSTGYFKILPFSRIRGEVYNIKCKYTISLVDATTIATRKY
ncbi:PIN domain-containing protein [Saccharolobus caldissimus]|uniref:PIN domain-containing protein n=1 Tax=Saccharolobus caldissimus TaxID=1702097 RepID=UPI003CD0CD0F